MTILVVLLTVLLILDCLILGLLVLIQLPKKEAGAGMAFGGGATDALFGAGSGNVLTKITKYVAGIFFALAVGMAWITHLTTAPDTSLIKALTTAPAISPGAVPSSNALISSPLTNLPQSKSSARAEAPGQSPASTTNAPGTPNLLTIPPPATGTNR